MSLNFCDPSFFFVLSLNLCVRKMDHADESMEDFVKEVNEMAVVPGSEFQGIKRKKYI